METTMSHQSDFGYSSGALSMRCVACGSYELNCCDGLGNKIYNDQNMRGWSDRQKDELRGKPLPAGALRGDRAKEQR
jgi:hypothetical protein